MIEEEDGSEQRAKRETSEKALRLVAEYLLAHGFAKLTRPNDYKSLLLTETGRAFLDSQRVKRKH